MFSKIWSGIKKAFSATVKYLDGKKVVIGFLATQASEVVEDPTIKFILYWGGTLLGGTGVAHKIKKGELKLPDGMRKPFYRNKNKRKLK